MFETGCRMDAGTGCMHHRLMQPAVVQECLRCTDLARKLLLPPGQMIAHHTAGGCNLRPGDLLASGTLSCEGPLGAGCLQEAT